MLSPGAYELVTAPLFSVAERDELIVTMAWNFVPVPVVPVTVAVPGVPPVPALTIVGKLVTLVVLTVTIGWIEYVPPDV